MTETTEQIENEAEDAMEQETPQEAVDAPETGQEPTDAPEDVEAPEDGQEDEQDTFPRAYVEKLRRENAEARTRAQKSDELAAALWEARVAATGRLADPTDLPLGNRDPMDPEAVTTAVEELLGQKPHLAARTPRGNIGQGDVGHSGDTVSLSGLLRSRV